MNGSMPTSRLWRPYAAVFLAFATLYALTAQRGPAWQDSGVFQWRVLNFDTVGSMGLALAHPLLIVLGKAFSFLPVGPLAWRVNMVSAICGAVAAANVGALAARLSEPAAGSATTVRRWAVAWFAACTFALAHTAWWVATISESQAILAAVFTTELHVLVGLLRQPRTHRAVLLGLLNGLALTAHNLALLALPAYGLTVLLLSIRRRIAWWSVPLFAACWAIGASGFLVPVLYQAAADGAVAAIRSALFGAHWQQHVLGASGGAVLQGCGYVLYNFPNLALPLMVVGLWSCRRRLGGPLATALGYLAAVYFLFAIRYQVADQFMFFLPFYAMVAAMAGLGLARLTEEGSRKWAIGLAVAFVLAGPVLYAAAPAVWRAWALPLPGRKDLPYRDAARYWLCPWKAGEDSAGRFAGQALARVPAGGVIVADATSRFPLLWAQKVEGAGTGVTVLGIEQATPARIPPGTPDVFVVSPLPGYHPRWMDDAATLRKTAQEDVLFGVSWSIERK